MHHTSIRYIRRLLAGIMILVSLAVLGNYFYKRFGRDHSGKQDLQILDPETLQSVESFEYSDNRDGIIRFKIRALRLLEENPGKVYLQEIEAFDFNPEGSVHNEIRSRFAEYDREKGTVVFIEDVRFSLGRDIELDTDTLHYDMNTNIGTTEDPVRFHSEKINGKAVGLEYRLDRKRLEMKRDVDFLLVMEKASPDGTAADERIRATSGKAFCHENGERIIFSNDARMRSDSLLLTGDTIRADIDGDLKEITSLNAAGNVRYRSETSDESRALGGDRMFFAIHAGSRNLEKIQVRGSAVLNSASPAGETRLQGALMDLFFDPSRDALQRIHCATGVQLRMKRGAEETLFSGERFNAFFNEETRGLKNIDVRERARILTKGSADSAGNEIRAARISVKFREHSGRVLFENLHAQGSAQWTVLPAKPERADGTSPSGSLKAEAIGMFYAGEGEYLERIQASGNVVMAEAVSDSGKGAYRRSVSAEKARFGFYPGGNKPKDMAAEGNVRVVYEGDPAQAHPETPGKFRTASDNLKAAFSPDADGIVLASASQWGNFKYEDGSKSATAGRCDYDAGSEKMTLTNSPEINFEAGFVNGGTAVLDLKQGILHVRRKVRSLLSAAPEAGLPGGGTSGAGSIVLADAMQYWTETGRALYTGGAQLISEEQQLRADTLEILDGGEEMAASGNVRHLLYRGRPSTDGGGTPENTTGAAPKDGGNLSGLPINIESSDFNYVKSSNTVAYSGKTSLTSAGLIIKSGTLEAVLDEGSREIEKATAKDEVSVFMGKREYRGDVAYYFRNPERFEISGKPAESVDPEGVRSSAPRLTYNVADDRILLEGRVD
ncbi:MAG: LPS export ABC transporter periplasmic protein LptC [Acidobacteria bacterium]|nr:LPS export ABC transporter periplasmic protein LptC [Acidobacteriota bacterium]